MNVVTNSGLMNKLLFVITEEENNMDNDDRFRKVQLLELEIAKEMKRICEKNNINYFLLWGSLLGAVRHEGFIPWDDDMDFGMLREDYEKFIEVCKKDLDPAFFLQTWDTDSEYPMHYAKLRLQGTHFVETFSEKASMNNGIFIDIVPFDHAPDGIVQRKIQGLKYFLCIRLLWIKKGMGESMKAESKSKKIKYISFLAFSKLFSFNNIKKYFKKVLNKYNAIQTKGIVGSASGYYRILPCAWAEKLENIKFEDIEMPAFKAKDEFLTAVYGDYMTLPPPEERQGHLPVDIDFGPYDVSLTHDNASEIK